MQSRSSASSFGLGGYDFWRRAITCGQILLCTADEGFERLGYAILIVAQREGPATLTAQGLQLVARVGHQDRPPGVLEHGLSLKLSPIAITSDASSPSVRA